MLNTICLVNQPERGSFVITDIEALAFEERLGSAILEIGEMCCRDREFGAKWDVVTRAVEILEARFCRISAVRSCTDRLDHRGT